MSSHRRIRPARPVVGRIALAGIALAGLSAAPGATVAVATPTSAPITTTDHDALWFGLLSAAAVAGAAGAQQLAGRRRA